MSLLDKCLIAAIAVLLFMQVGMWYALTDTLQALKKKLNDVTAMLPRVDQLRMKLRALEKERYELTHYEAPTGAEKDDQRQHADDHEAKVAPIRSRYDDLIRSVQAEIEAELEKAQGE